MVFAYLQASISVAIGVFAVASAIERPVHSNFCPPSTLAWTETRLFFGRNIAASAEVSAKQWRRFTIDEIIPRFGDGFTVLDASGYWRGEGCKPTDAELNGGCEKTKLLLVQYPPSEAADAKLNAIAKAYVERFSQEAVMRSDSAVCTRFITKE